MKSEKSYRRNSQIIKKSFIWDWKKLLVYAKVFAFAVLKVFCLRDDVLESSLWIALFKCS